MSTTVEAHLTTHTAVILEEKLHSQLRAWQLAHFVDHSGILNEFAHDFIGRIAPGNARVLNKVM